MAYYYTSDHLGSVRELVDGSGNILTRYGYDVYGKVTTTYVSGTHDSTKQYAGMQVHLPSGLYLSKGIRIYDPATGRWDSTDPSGENGGINLYAYCSDDPIDYSDPFGLEQVAFTVISVIRAPDPESGVKTKHSVVVDTETGKIVSESKYIGPTMLRGRAYSGKGTLTATASGGHGCIDVNFSGRVHSFFLPTAHIEYDFDIQYNSNSGKITVSGYHTQYPSFEVYKNSTKIYDFQQGETLGFPGSGLLNLKL
jgi:RHS repeat-associated protein